MPVGWDELKGLSREFTHRKLQPLFLVVPQTNQKRLLSLLGFRNKTLLTKQQNFFSHSGGLGVQDQDPGSISPSWAICFKDLLIDLFSIDVHVCESAWFMCIIILRSVWERVSDSLERAVNHPWVLRP